MSTPNVLWIFGDQHRAQALGYAGDPNVATPHIDKLAADGLRVNGAVGGCPLCGPYRGSLLTGRYPHHVVPGHEYPLPDGMPTIAAPFNAAGYHTAWFGKWHVDGWQERNGRAAFHHVRKERRGEFETWLGYDNNNLQWDSHVHGHDESGKEIERYLLPGYETDELTNLLLAYLEKRKADGSPFFAGLSVQPPHNPYKAPQEFMDRHTPEGVQLRPNVPRIPVVEEKARRDLAGYYAMIENLDWNVGRIVSALEKSGLIDNTHILFFSDHGDMHGSQGQFLKTNPFEESIRVPMLLSGARGLNQKGGTTETLLINHVDLAPTSLGLCGLPVPTEMAGTDYSEFRRSGAGSAPDSAFLQLVIPTLHADSTDRPWRGIVTRDGWKYVCLEHQPWLLFNLNDDPYEQMNLAHNVRHAKKRRELNDRLAKWIADTGDTFALPVMN